MAWSLDLLWVSSSDVWSTMFSALALDPMHGADAEWKLLQVLHLAVLTGLACASLMSRSLFTDFEGPSSASPPGAPPPQ